MREIIPQPIWGDYGLRVAVRDGVGVRVIVGVPDDRAVEVKVAVAVFVAVDVGVRVDVEVAVGVSVRVAVGVRVSVGVRDGVGVREGVDVNSIKKKWKNKAFAAGVDRTEIEHAAVDLGVPLDEHIGRVLQAMQAIAPVLGLDGSLAK